MFFIALQILLLSFNMMHKKKCCLIKITNKDQLCCARAIVTMKVYVDRYDPIKKTV